MLPHYIKIAFRNLSKDKVQSLIGMIGLAVGLVSFTLGYQWLKYETSFDGFYPQSDQMYLISSFETQTGKKEMRLPMALAGVLKQEFPEITDVIPIYGRYGTNFKENDRQLTEPNQQYVDESFFKYFTPRVIAGRSQELITTDEDLVITRSYAEKNWSSLEEALGKTLSDGYKRTYTIVAIIEDYPENSLHHPTEAFLMDLFTRRFEQHVEENLKWKQTSLTSLYICVDKRSDVKTLKAKLKTYLIDRKYNEYMELEMTPLTGVRHAFETNDSFNLGYIKIFTATTFVLWICVFLNFLNLWINKIYRRTKEMRLRYAVGAGRITLLWQLMVELALQLLLVLILSLCLIELFAPLFVRMFEVKLELDHLWLNHFIIFLVSVLLMVCACFPLFLFFVRGSVLRSSGGVQARYVRLLRKSAMVFQIGICIAFIFCAFSIGRQVAFMMNKELGFKKEGLIHFIMSNDDREAAVRELERISLIESFSSSGVFCISHTPHTTNIVEWEGKAAGYKPNFEMIECDYEFFRTLRLTILEQKESDKEIKMNKNWFNRNKVFVNEEAARIIGMEGIIGRKIKVWNKAILRGGVHDTDEVEIVGVVKNFQSSSLRNPIIPQLIRGNSKRYKGYSYYARVPDGREQEGVRLIRDAFLKVKSSFDPDPYIHTVDEVFKTLHKSEYASFHLFTLLAILSVIISLFGIYSISYSTIQRRRKEIAVRKIMGGSTKVVMMMIIKEYVQIAFVACAIFLPIGWLFVRGWLDQFPYRVSIHILWFISIFVLSVVLILLTVFGQVLKASSQNPAEVIKNE